MDDALWQLPLSDAALIAIFAGVVVLVTVIAAVWAVAVPESAPRPDRDATARIVERRHEDATQVAHVMDDETGRTDPAVVWTR
ncbi:hypothetical protein BRM3_02900 [Brachybacterium huguangmaarense]|uniref:Uncharacterized protein n=1 Tax=Brachybacterium huguangmaarense TaxID=1652028 RepID=A0ABY6G424_9MICO|nr:hypothetical protein [Brachybacterium huguangmaarense]UYG17398.1 hypothetical protein BRM3_02900 [Brachybacterium huguangmaarense]